MNTIIILLLIIIIAATIFIISFHSNQFGGKEIKGGTELEAVETIEGYSDVYKINANTAAECKEIITEIRNNTHTSCKTFSYWDYTQFLLKLKTDSTAELQILYECGFKYINSKDNEFAKLFKCGENELLITRFVPVRTDAAVIAAGDWLCGEIRKKFDIVPGSNCQDVFNLSLAPDPVENRRLGMMTVMPNTFYDIVAEFYKQHEDHFKKDLSGYKGEDLAWILVQYILRDLMLGEEKSDSIFYKKYKALHKQNKTDKTDILITHRQVIKDLYNEVIDKEI